MSERSNREEGRERAVRIGKIWEARNSSSGSSQMPPEVPVTLVVIGPPGPSVLGRAALLGQIVLLELVAELPERHSEQIRRLGLHSARPLERPLQVPAL